MVIAAARSAWVLLSLRRAAGVCRLRLLFGLLRFPHAHAVRAVPALQEGMSEEEEAVQGGRKRKAAKQAQRGAVAFEDDFLKVRAVRALHALWAEFHALGAGFEMKSEVVAR